MDPLVVSTYEAEQALPLTGTGIETLIGMMTQKRKSDTDELKHRLIDIWDRIPQGIIDEAIDQWQTRMRACVTAKGHHFEHLLRSSHITSSFHSHFRHIKISSFQSHSHY